MQVARWGNRLGIRISGTLAEKMSGMVSSEAYVPDRGDVVWLRFVIA